MITTATKITKSEYRACEIAIDENNNIWLLFQNGKHLWVGQEHGQYAQAQNDKVEEREIAVTDENGCRKYVTARVYKTTDKRMNDLDLEALANGKIEWC